MATLTNAHNLIITNSVAGSGLVATAAYVTAQDVHDTKVVWGRAEQTLLQRIAYMAGRLLPAIRATELATARYAEVTALSEALLDLQAAQTTMGSILGNDDLRDDLVALLDDLGELPSA